MYICIQKINKNYLLTYLLTWVEFSTKSAVAPIQFRPDHTSQNRRHVISSQPYHYDFETLHIVQISRYYLLALIKNYSYHCNMHWKMQNLFVDLFRVNNLLS
uniref:Uncharacterized protein n=1 Tax=Cacopsylla melanoneura TaxID=428564 RepID=A0A8D8LYU5_9HEMI